MASKAKSGLTSVRQYFEDILVPPNKFTPGAPSFISAVRDGKGHAAVHAGATNDTPGTLNIFQAWQSSGPFVLTDAVVTSVDPGGSGLFVASITTPIIRRFVQIQFAPSTVLGGEFELGAYFQPHADTSKLSAPGGGPGGGGGGGGGGGAVTGSPGVTITTPVDVVVGVAATVPLPAPPAGTRRITVQNTGPVGTLIRVRELAGAVGAGIKLSSLGVATFGGLDGAVRTLEVQEVASPGLATTVSVEFEGT